MTIHLHNLDELVREGDELLLNDRSRALTVTGIHTRTPFEETPEDHIEYLNTIELEGNGTQYHLKTGLVEHPNNPLLYTESQWEETTGEDAVGYPYTYTGDGDEIHTATFDVHDLRRVPREATFTIRTDEYTFTGTCVGKEVDEPDYMQGSASLVFEGDWWEDIKDTVDTEVLTVRQRLERRTGNPKIITVHGTTFTEGDNGTIEELVTLGSALRVTITVSTDT